MSSRSAGRTTMSKIAVALCVVLLVTRADSYWNDKWNNAAFAAMEKVGVDLVSGVERDIREALAMGTQHIEKILKDAFKNTIRISQKIIDHQMRAYDEIAKLQLQYDAADTTECGEISYPLWTNSTQSRAMSQANRCIFEILNERHSYMQRLEEFSIKAGYKLAYDLPNVQNCRYTWEDNYRRVKCVEEAVGKAYEISVIVTPTIQALGSKFSTWWQTAQLKLKKCTDDVALDALYKETSAMINVTRECLLAESKLLTKKEEDRVPDQSTRGSR